MWFKKKRRNHLTSFYIATYGEIGRHYFSSFSYLTMIKNRIFVCQRHDTGHVRREQEEEERSFLKEKLNQLLA